MADPDLWVVGLDGPTGVGSAINNQVVFEGANSGYMLASMWAAGKGVDFDEEIDGVNMGSLRTISDSIRAGDG